MLNNKTIPLHQIIFIAKQYIFVDINISTNLKKKIIFRIQRKFYVRDTKDFNAQLRQKPIFHTLFALT